MKKMKKKIKKAESDVVRAKQQQQRERVADDVVDRHSNEFPNFMALTKEEKLAFFESLNAARKNVIDSGNKVTERFGTVHDEYLKYFGSVEDNEGSKSFKDLSQTLECSGMCDSVSSSLRSESYKPTHSAIPRRIMTKPMTKPAVCISMNTSINSSTPSITSSKISLESKSLTSKEDEDRDNGGSGNNSIQTKSLKGERLRDDDSDQVKTKSSSRFVTKLPMLKKRESQKAQKDERKSEMSISNKSGFEALESDEKEIFFSTLKEARDNVLAESPHKDNEILSMKAIMKKYEKPEEETSTSMKVPYRKETFIKANNLKVKVIITSSDSKKIKKERVSKSKETRRRSEKEKTKKATGVVMEKDKKSKAAERKLVRSTDGIRRKQQRQNNSIVMTRKPKENKKENVKARKKEDSIKRSEKACQNKRNKEEGKVLVKTERSVIKNPGGKQEKNKILASRKKIKKDKSKEKRKKSKKEQISRKSEQIEQELVLVEEEKKEVAEEVKEDSGSSGEGVAEASGGPTETAETVKREAESIGTFFFVNKFKYTDEVEDEVRDKKENNQRENNFSLKSFQNEFGEEVKCLEVDSVDDKGGTLSMGTTDEEITIEVEEEISITKTPLPVKSEVRYQPEQIEADFNRKRHTEKSKSLILELKLKGEDQDDCYVGKASSHLVTSDDDSVLQLWEELKLLQLSDSDCVVETESMTAQMGSENISESRFTFFSNKISPNKVCLAEEKLIVIGSENKVQEGEGRREAAVLDLLKSEGLIVVDGDAIEKIKNLVEALEKEAEPKGGTKMEVKPEKNLESKYSQLLLAYIDYLTRLLYMLTNKREQKSKTRVRAPLTAAGSHPEFLDNKNKKLEFIEKPRTLSDTNVLKDKKTEVEVKAKESTPQDSEVEANSSSLLPFSDSPMTESSCEDDVPLVTSPSTRKKLIEDFVRERAKFVEESVDGFRIIKMASEVQAQESGQNRTKFKFFHIFSRFCKCIKKKKGSEEDQVQRRQQRTGGKENH